MSAAWIYLCVSFGFHIFFPFQASSKRTGVCCFRVFPKCEWKKTQFAGFLCIPPAERADKLWKIYPIFRRVPTKFQQNRKLVFILRSFMNKHINFNTLALAFYHRDRANATRFFFHHFRQWSETLETKYSILLSARITSQGNCAFSITPTQIQSSRNRLFYTMLQIRRFITSFFLHLNEIIKRP